MWHVRLEDDGIAGLEPVRLGVAARSIDDDLELPLDDDEVLDRAGRVRIGGLRGLGREAQLVELGAARPVEREERA